MGITWDLIGCLTGIAQKLPWIGNFVLPIQEQITYWCAMTGCPVKLPYSIKCCSKNEEVNFCSRGGPAAGQPPDRGQKKSVYPKAFLRSRAGYGRGGALFFLPQFIHLKIFLILSVISKTAGQTSVFLAVNSISCAIFFLLVCGYSRQALGRDS